MQNLMRIARALSKRRKDSIAIEVDDLAARVRQLNA